MFVVCGMFVMCTCVLCRCVGCANCSWLFEVLHCVVCVLVGVACLRKMVFVDIVVKYVCCVCVFYLYFGRLI